MGDAPMGNVVKLIAGQLMFLAAEAGQRTETKHLEPGLMRAAEFVERWDTEITMTCTPVNHDAVASMTGFLGAMAGAALGRSVVHAAIHPDVADSILNQLKLLGAINARAKLAAQSRSGPPPLAAEPVVNKRSGLMVQASHGGIAVVAAHNIGATPEHVAPEVTREVGGTRACPTCQGATQTGYICPACNGAQVVAAIDGEAPGDDDED